MKSAFTFTMLLTLSPVTGFPQGRSDAFTGRVLDSTGAPVLGAHVEVRDLEGKLVAATTTSEDGGFTMSVPPGRYRVAVSLAGFSGWQQDVVAGETLEAVLLVAHGAGSDEDDRHWNEVLASLARWMEARAAPPFHAIEGVTLREDWPEPHRRALSAIEEKVKAHRGAGRRVIAVEARLNGPGPTRSLLEPLGVTVDDEGFAPHPNLSRLVLRDLEEYVAGTAKASESARR